MSKKNDKPTKLERLMRKKNELQQAKDVLVAGPLNGKGSDAYAEDVMIDAQSELEDIYAQFDALLGYTRNTKLRHHPGFALLASCMQTLHKLAHDDGALAAFARKLDKKLAKTERKLNAALQEAGQEATTKGITRGPTATEAAPAS